MRIGRQARNALVREVEDSGRRCSTLQIRMEPIGAPVQKGGLAASVGPARDNGSCRPVALWQVLYVVDELRERLTRVVNGGKEAFMLRVLPRAERPGIFGRPFGDTEGIIQDLPRSPTRVAP